MKATPRDDGTQLPPELDLDLVALARSGLGPYEVQAELPAPWMATVLAHTDAEVTSGGATSLEVTAIGEGTSYLVRGRIQGGYSVPCARCLAPAPVSAGGEICVHFVRDRVSDADDEESETESPDERSFSGTHIDLRPLLVEQVLLSYPIRALCAYGEACRGLCMRCGAELNGQPLGPCAACGATDAQVPIVTLAEEDDDEAPAKPTTSWQAALRQLADAGVDGDDDTDADNLGFAGPIPGVDDFDPGFGEPEPRPGDKSPSAGKRSGPPVAKPASRSSAAPAGKSGPASKSAGAPSKTSKSPGKAAKLAKPASKASARPAPKSSGKPPSKKK